MRIHDRGGGISAEINDACLFVTIGNFGGNVCRFILLAFIFGGPVTIRKSYSSQHTTKLLSL